MDDERFDRLTRALSGAFGRRAAVRTLAGGAVATTLGAAGLAGAAAKGTQRGKKAKTQCRPKGHPCQTEPNACCQDLICGSTPNSGSDIRCCTEGPTCQPICGSGGACGSNEVCCNGTCVTGVCCTDQDCSSGQTCDSDHQCVTPTCDPACPEGQTCCSDNTCVDTDTDPANCGACGHACDNDQTCVGGVCTGGGCKSDADCQPNGLCLINGTCFFPSTCPVGESNLDCCRNAVKKACRHRGGSKSPHGNGHLCRKKGKRRCQKNFGNT